MFVGHPFLVHSAKDISEAQKSAWNAEAKIIKDRGDLSVGNRYIHTERHLPDDHARRAPSSKWNDMGKWPTYKWVFGGVMINGVMCP